jgi:Flp pilus assembly protein TadB
MNVLINGHYQFLVNGRKVTFQWFEGVQWQKNDLNEVISGLLNNSPNVVTLENAPADNGLFGIVMSSVYSILLQPPIIIAAAIVLVAVLFLVRRSRKRKAERNRKQAK